MAFKAGFIVIASDADPNKDRVLIKPPKFELTTVLVELMNLVGQAGVSPKFLKGGNLKR